MLSVTNLAGQTEPLNQIQRFEMTEEVNSAFMVSLTSFSVANNPAHELIEEESIVNVDGYDFRVKQMKERLNRKEITGISTYFDLNGHRQDAIYGGTRTFNEFATFAFAGTGWTFENADVSGSVFIPNFGDDNVIKLVQVLCAAFDCEFKIMPNQHILFADKIGPDNDAQYRYGHNVKALSRSVDTTNMRTQITGYGGDGLTITYTSPNATKYGIHKAEPFRDERFTIANSLTARLKQELKDYPDTTIELDSIELTDKELGERVWLIYEPLGIEFQTRVMSKKTVLRNDKLVTASVTIGNIVPRNLSDILTSQKVEIDENKKETRSRFEQTNERITLEVERIDESLATISVEADEIKLSVQQLDGRMGNAESQISIQADQIMSKVSYTDYNGNTIASLINQTATTITLSAEKIQMSGITEVANSLYIGGRYGDATREIRFGGQLGGARISADNPNVLDLWAGGGYIGMNSPVAFMNEVNFGGASVNGLYARYG
ncbi:phage tail protein [Sporosarcina sp. OR05]|uniref:phage tail protein n=1 Tax=Sporosarcina sp. OR05 TaxID=2969819 RepID=UPI00352B670B